MAANISEDHLEATKAAMLAEDDGLDIQDRSYYFRKFPRCFIGSEAVTFMVDKKLASSPAEAVNIGQMMMDAGWLSHVCNDHPFKDAHLFYRFTEHGIAAGPSWLSMLALARPLDSGVLGVDGGEHLMFDIDKSAVVAVESAEIRGIDALYVMRVRHEEDTWTVKRSYLQFELIHNVLTSKGWCIPSLPPPCGVLSTGGDAAVVQARVPHLDEIARHLFVCAAHAWEIRYFLRLELAASARANATVIDSVTSSLPLLLDADSTASQTGYVVEVVSPSGRAHRVVRSFSDFAELHRQLSTDTIGAPLPPMPDATWLHRSASSPQVVAVRKRTFDTIVRFLVATPGLRDCDLVRTFFDLPLVNVVIPDEGVLS